MMQIPPEVMTELEAACQTPSATRIDRAVCSALFMLLGQGMQRQKRECELCGGAGEWRFDLDAAPEDEEVLVTEESGTASEIYIATRVRGQWQSPPYVVHPRAWMPLPKAPA